MLTKEQLQWAEETLERVERKLARVSERSADKIPYTTVKGVHDDKSGEESIGWWTNGFWGGMMWQMYALTGKERYREIAMENEKKLDASFLNYNAMDHDNGFKWLPTAVANYRMTKNKESRNRGFLAATILAGRYNCAGKYIRAWNDWTEESREHRGWAIIDCMMNLPLLYWASEEMEDPRFAQIAQNHADTAQKAFIREDGSVKHIVEFDAFTGEYVQDFGGQGYGQGSSWTRGQAWALYGFTLSYIHTQKEEYLATAAKVADYFIANISASGLIPVDFRQPREVSWQDATAAAIAACGLLELAKQKEGKEQEKYEQAAWKLLQALADKSCNWKEEEDNLLENCTAAYHDKEHEFSIIYGDYYFVEALMKLTGKELFIW